MNLKARPFGIYRHNQYHGRKGMWERCGSYKTMEDAFNAIKAMTKRPRKERIFAYVILPNKGRERWVLIPEHNNLLKTAR
jgi:hypothetical protein